VATSDSRFVLRPDSQRKFESFLAVPLVTSGACIGVLSATEAKPDRFTEHDEDVLTLVAAICTPHLESARLARDMKVVVRVPALDALEHPAVLVHVDETASPTTRMVECLAELTDPAQTLKPGFYAVANVETRTARALAVPESALQPTERGWVAYVVIDGKATLRPLTLAVHRIPPKHTSRSRSGISLDRPARL
jgi:hypothetical protein